MAFFIVFEKDVIKLNKMVTESMPVFIQRVEFLIRALDKGKTLEASIPLSYAYQNKMMYGVKYPDPVEDDILRINNPD